MPEDPNHIPKLSRIHLQLGQYPILGDVMRERMREELFRRGVITRQRFEEEVRERAVQSQRREGIINPYHEESADVGAAAGHGARQPHRVLLGLQPQPAAFRADRTRSAASNDRLPSRCSASTRKWPRWRSSSSRWRASPCCRPRRTRACATTCRRQRSC